LEVIFAPDTLLAREQGWTSPRFQGAKTKGRRDTMPMKKKAAKKKKKKH
jgi:hypothetical protein